MKKWIMVGLVTALCGSVQAEPIRTALTKENRLPRLYQWESGAEFYYQEYKNNDELISVVPYLRRTVLRDFALFATVPYSRFAPEMGTSESGIGDATVGFEFVAYKDLFGYPWIMPHGEIKFDTGDEDKGLGTGETEYMIGVALGTTIRRSLHFAADVRYRIMSDEDNIPSLGLSIVWDLDNRFSLLAEMEIARRKDRDEIGFREDDSNPITFLAGMHYRATRNQSFTIHGGGVNNSGDDGVDSIIRGKYSYRF